MAVFSDVPAIDDGSTAAQLFVGHESLVPDAYCIKTKKQFVAIFGEIDPESLFLAGEQSSVQRNYENHDFDNENRKEGTT